jgi:hypothetical protein
MGDFLEYMMKHKEINLKCLYIGGGLAVAHELLPKGVPGAIAVMLLSYVGIAYYDAYELCDLKLSAGTPLHFLTADVKPPIDSEGNYSFKG